MELFKKLILPPIGVLLLIIGDSMILTTNDKWVELFGTYAIMLAMTILFLVLTWRNKK